jgi:DNA-binding MarR family transcriptional regulator
MKRPPASHAPARVASASLRASTAAARRLPRGAASAATDVIELGILDGLIGFHLRQAQDAAFCAFRRHPALRGFEPGRFAVMMIIHYNPDITQSSLGHVIARDKSTVTPILQDLQRQGLIERRQSSRDHRNIRLRLTRRGEKALFDLLQHVHEHDRTLDHIVGDAKPVLLDLLRKIAKALR